MDNLLNIYARNCTVSRIDGPAAAGFLTSAHRLGYCRCRYHYGLFVRRTTGAGEHKLAEGTLVAVASFSGARRFRRSEGSIIRSYEWVRYASLPGMRVSGGMSRLLSSFIEEFHPDDVMSYADPTSEDGGRVYEKLGFVCEGTVVKPSFSCLKYRYIPKYAEDSDY